MRFNEKELITISQRQGDMVGRLQYTQIKGPPGSYKNAGFRDRFFKLVGNLLFYFRFNDVGSVDYKEPVGVLVLENYSVQPEFDMDLGNFAFGILFLDEPNDKRHVFAARTDNDVQLWINKLQTASYQHWSEQLVLKRNLLKTLLASRQPENSAPINEIQQSQGNLITSKSVTSSRPEPLLISLDSNPTHSTTISSMPLLQTNVAPAVPPRPGTRIPNTTILPTLPPPPLPTRNRPATTTTNVVKKDEDLMKF